MKMSNTAPTDPKDPIFLRIERESQYHGGWDDLCYFTGSPPSVYSVMPGSFI